MAVAWFRTKTSGWGVPFWLTCGLKRKRPAPRRAFSDISPNLSIERCVNSPACEYRCKPLMDQPDVWQDVLGMSGIIAMNFGHSLTGTLCSSEAAAFTYQKKNSANDLRGF